MYTEFWRALQGVQLNLSIKNTSFNINLSVYSTLVLFLELGFFKKAELSFHSSF